MISFDPAGTTTDLYGYNVTWSSYLETTGEYYHYVSWEGIGSLYLSMTSVDFLQNNYNDSLVSFNSTTQLYLVEGIGTVYGVDTTSDVPISVLVTDILSNQILPLKTPSEKSL